ncbi:hypothetical protein PATA110615_28950 [Paenibacillus taichungensis]|nr:hypothetical protein SAMN03159332_6247 [Paenibacillus sp. 276b]
MDHSVFESLRQAGEGRSNLRVAPDQHPVMEKWINTNPRYHDLIELDSTVHI